MSITKVELYDRVSGRISVGNIEHSEDQSEETFAYSATVFLDGERAGVAKNSGRGGKTRLTADIKRSGGESKRIDRIEELRAAVAPLPPVESSFGDMEYDAERVVDLLAEVEAKVHAKAEALVRQGHAVYRFEDQHLFEFGYAPKKGQDTEAVVEAVEDTEGQAITHVFIGGRFQKRQKHRAPSSA